MLRFVLFSACCLFLKQCRTTAEVKFGRSQTWGKLSVQFALSDLQGIHCLAWATNPLQHQRYNCRSLPPRTVLAQLTHCQVIYGQCCQMTLCIRDQTWGRGQQNHAGRPQGPVQVTAHLSAQRSSLVHRPPGREGCVKPCRAYFACRKWMKFLPGSCSCYVFWPVRSCFRTSVPFFFFPCLNCEFHIRY